MSLRPLAGWNCRFDSHRGHESRIGAVGPRGWPWTICLTLETIWLAIYGNDLGNHIVDVDDAIVKHFSIASSTSTIWFPRPLPYMVNCMGLKFNHMGFKANNMAFKVNHMVFKANHIVQGQPRSWPPLFYYGYLPLVSVVRCQIEVSAQGWSLFQSSPTECGVSECYREASIMRNPGPLEAVTPWGKNTCYSFFEAVISGSLSPRYGVSSVCVWRNGLQIIRVAANILNKQSRTSDK